MVNHNSDMGENCVIANKCLLIPFTAEGGGVMLLKRIKIGDGCQLHLKSALAPGVCRVKIRFQSDVVII